MVTNILTKEQRDNFVYIPELAQGYGDDGTHYTWSDLMNIARGNEKVAYLLYLQCIDCDAWAYPETYLDDDLRCDEVFEDKHGDYHINPDYDFNLVLED